MSWERARKPEQKAIRRDAILRAARKLFASEDYEAISLNGIARLAGFTKPNVYRYFATREEIFLTIFHIEQESFVSALIARVSRMRSQDAVSRIAEIWVEESLKRPTLLKLLPELMTSLEKNSSVEQIVEFKRTTKLHFQQLVDALANACPKLDREQWIVAIQSISALAAGLWPMCNPADNVREAMKIAEFDHSWQYETLMKQGIISLIQGTQQNKGTQS